MWRLLREEFASLGWPDISLYYHSHKESAGREVRQKRGRRERKERGRMGRAREEGGRGEGRNRALTT